jgi:signal transduction histidine kinase
MKTSPDESDRTASPDPDWPSHRLRWVLLGAFLGLLGLLLISGAAASRTLKRMQQQEQVARRDVADRTRNLSGLYLSIEVYNETIQRYAACPEGKPDPVVRQQVDRLTADIGSQLNRYPPNRQPEEAAFLQAILDQFVRHRDLYASILVLGPQALHGREQLLINDQILSMRSQFLESSDQLQAWNTRQFRQTDETLLAQFGRMQSSLTESLSIALGAGLLLAMASMAYIVRLERQTSGRYRELAHSRHELERLSSRLVDVQEAERRSISRELHDEVGQSLGALLVDLGSLSSNLPEDRIGIKERLDNMKSVAERTVGTVRDIALLLRPSMLDDLGLIAALEWQCREVSRRSEMEVTVEPEDVSEDLPDEYKICVYRLVQEALNNAVRHARARNAKVRVAQNQNGIAIEVSDDGRGFQPERARGLGILGMEERVKRLGGTLTVDSTPGRGSAIKAELPLPAPAGKPS